MNAANSETGQFPSGRKLRKTFIELAGRRTFQMPTDFQLAFRPSKCKLQAKHQYVYKYSCHDTRKIRRVVCLAQQSLFVAGTEVR